MVAYDVKAGEGYDWHTRHQQSSIRLGLLLKECSWDVDVPGGGFNSLCLVGTVPSFFHRGVSDD
jgi:hypothetical protein